MRGGKSPKLAEKGIKKAPGQNSGSTAGSSRSVGNGGSNVAGKKRKKGKDQQQLPPNSSSVNQGKGSSTDAKETMKGSSASKRLIQACSGK